jgi:hypothetical protein
MRNELLGGEFAIIHEYYSGRETAHRETAHRETARER